MEIDNEELPSGAQVTGGTIVLSATLQVIGGTIVLSTTLQVIGGGT